MTEDQVRDKAGKLLGFKVTETAISGVGQITSFNQLGFIGVKDRPKELEWKNKTNCLLRPVFISMLFPEILES